MYDTIKIMLNCFQADRDDFCKEIESAREAGFSLNFEEGVFHYAKGTVKNFLAVLTTECLILEGSLSKFYYNTNCGVMQRSDVERAIKRLSVEAFNLPLERAFVWRLDVALNIITKRPVKEYINLFNGVKRNTEKIIINESSVRFEYSRKRKGKIQCKGALAVYDKIRETVERKQDVDEIFKGCNLLRIERRFFKEISRQIGYRNLRCADLYREEFYLKLLKKVKDDFMCIEKQKVLTLPTESKGMKATKERLYLNFVHSEEFEAKFGCSYAEFLQKEVEAGNISKQEKCRELKRMQAVFKVADDAAEDEKEKELKEKIGRAFSSYR